MEREIMTETAETTAPAPIGDEEGWEWCFVEILGHRSHWCRSREVEKVGAKMLRVDVPINGDPVANGWMTVLYGGGSIFSYTLSDEKTVMKKNKPWQEAARLTYREDDEEE
jgi:hypothetical protein